jgi:hypothetical protein
VLRIETVINDPKEFKVRRRCIQGGQEVMAWRPMSKGVANLYCYQEQTRAANGRYLAALCAAEEPPQSIGDLHRLGESCRRGARSYAGFNPACAGDMALFACLCQGAYLLHGFRNHDVRGTLFPDQTGDAQEKRRKSAAVGRILKRLHVRGLLIKIPHSRRCSQYLHRPTGAYIFPPIAAKRWNDLRHTLPGEIDFDAGIADPRFNPREDASPARLTA